VAPISAVQSYRDAFDLGREHATYAADPTRAPYTTRGTESNDPRRIGSKLQRLQQRATAAIAASVMAYAWRFVVFVHVPPNNLVDVLSATGDSGLHDCRSPIYAHERTRLLPCWSAQLEGGASRHRSVTATAARGVDRHGVGCSDNSGALQTS